MNSVRTLLPLTMVMLATITFGLLGCNSSDKPKSSIPQITRKFAQATVLQGVVTGKTKAITSGSVQALDHKGHQLSSVTLQQSNHYQLNIEADTQLPIILKFIPEQGSSDNEQLIAVVVDPAVSHYDLSPLTTAIAKKAEALGGYTRANMVMAAENSVNVPDANKTSTGFRGDPTTQYGGWH